ncbi:Hypothetical predicted protein [Cloeon dipterum]|uniref:Endothelin-converting enzyme 1 n=2 Tax=Cloeon dipterum TaxID=197152 RepID=A0A8S1CLC0_9INSE|nr:Hypothetical predicted protein [Cloeon dipterum]
MQNLRNLYRSCIVCYLAGIIGFLLLALFLCFAFFAVPFLGQLVFHLPFESRTNHTTCETAECFDSAARIRLSMDATVNPCENFYQFACGGWIEKNPIPKRLPMVSQFTILTEDVTAKIKYILEAVNTNSTLGPLKQARSLYKACLDDEKMEEISVNPLFRTLAELGFYYFNNQHQPSLLSVPNWQKTIAWSEKLLGTSLLFNMDVIRHPKNTSKHVIYISDGNLKSFMDNALKFNNVDRDAEIDLMADYISLLPKNSEKHRTEAETIAQEAYNLSRELKHLQEELKKDVTALPYEEMTLANLQRITDSEMDKENAMQTRFVWLDYMETVFNGLNLNWDKERVIVKNSLYFKSWTKLMRESGYQTIRSFQWWKIFSYLAPFTTNKFRAPQRKALKAGPKWKDCAEGVAQIFGMAIGHEYVSKYFEKNQKEKVAEMVTNIKSALKDRMESRNWMDNATKKLAMEKIDTVSSHVGFSDRLFVPGEIEEYYQSLHIVDGEWFTSMINIHVFMHHLKVKKLAEQSHSLYGIQSPVAVNAFYSIDSNSITIPAAILRPPLYGLGLEALNYGAIGTIIGHELIHGFDDRGRHRDLNGNQKQWWTNESVAEFNKRKQCLIEQISQYSYKIADTNYKVNGEVTQGENIADSGGIHVALHAYDLMMARRKQSQMEDPEPSLSGLTGFSNRQLFFLSFANVMCKSLTDYAKKALLKDEHNLSEFRVLGTLSNMREFAEAWSCPVGSKMNPANKCVLW